LEPHQQRKRRITLTFGDEADGPGLEGVLEALDASVWTLRPDGQMGFCNRRWAEYSGLCPGEATVASCLALVHPDERACAEEQWQNALRGDDPPEARYRLRRSADGAYRWHLCRLQPVGRAEDGWVMAATDVHQLMVLATDMREEIAVRDEAERRDGALLARAQRDNRAKDQFLALLGHELRNPLAPIVVALKLLRMRGAPAELRELGIIERQVDHLVRLVDDLLDVSRITRGTIRLRKERVELAAVVSRAVEMACPLLEQREQHLMVEVSARDLPLDADRERLAQVIANLLTNAAKYTEPRGHIRVTATAAPYQGGRGVAIRVNDDGRGMTPDLLASVFDMFVQGNRPIDRSEGGLGLGLTIVRTLIELHGGDVSARSDGPGQGSEFLVRLPLAAETVEPAAEPTARAPSPEAGRRVLVVDDNADVVEVMGDLLRISGFEVAVAHDAPEALRLAGRFDPEVAVLDIGLPVMDGYELARRLRLANPELRLVAVTGYGQAEDRERSRAVGFHEHLVKPVDGDVLLAAIAAKPQ
jgi:PAS domain S-box-containing protein